MDIGSLGAIYFNDIQMGSNIVNHEKNQVNGIGGFEALLKKASETQVSDSSLPNTQSSNTVKIDKTDELYEQCMELEIFLVKTLISSMRNTIQKSSLIDQGYAGKMYEDMLYDEYARSYAKNANFGLAEMAYLELSGQRNKVIIKN